jgi:hypothetical protein
MTAILAAWQSQQLLKIKIPAVVLVALLKERVAIAEFEGGLDREAAEWLAWAEVTEKMEGAAP